ncbi:FimV family protein [Accumulibacter sp.]|uniref:type IV pilus assembly protein FimV n=1 Tax=Accumulibacter sp. TaxID=2053492 RepID=UPI0035AE93B9
MRAIITIPAALWGISSLLSIVALAVGDRGGLRSGQATAPAALASPTAFLANAAFVGEGYAAIPDRHSASRGENPRLRKVSLELGPADRLLIFADADADYRSAGAEQPPLRLSSRLSTSLLGQASDGQRSMLRTEYRLLSALYAQAEQQLAVAEQLSHLEAVLADLQKGSGTPTPPAASPNLLPRAAPAAAPRPLTPHRGAAAGLEKGGWWLELAALLGLIGGLSWLFGRRAGWRAEPQLIPAVSDLPLDTSDDSGWELQASSSPDAPPVESDSDVRAHVVPVTDSVSAKPAQPCPQGDDAELSAALELAEIMASFGRTRGAEQALEEFVSAHPRVALTPWLRLIELYRENGQRQAFEALGLRLRRHFNVAAPEWELVGEAPGPMAPVGAEQVASIDQLLPRLPTLGREVRITTEISRTWGSPECLAYLNRLLRDNRDGERKGFASGAVRELLLLIELLENRLVRAV